MMEQKRSDPLSEMIRDAVRDVLNEFHNRPQRNIYTEAEVMEMLGVSSRSTMAALRRDGLMSHRVGGNKRVYLLDEVEDYVRGGEAW